MVRDLLVDAYAEGRLTHAEHLERLDAVNSSRTLGELIPLFNDVVVPAQGWTPTSSIPRWGRILLTATGGAWILVAFITNAVWVITMVGSGHLHAYWPIWPMFGMSIPLLASLIIAVAAGREGRHGIEPRHEPPGELPPA